MPRLSKVALRNIMKRANSLEKQGYSKKRAMQESWRIHKMQKGKYGRSKDNGKKTFV